MNARFTHRLAGAVSSPVAAPVTPSWQVYRYTGYFQREQIAVFFDHKSAEDYALAHMRDWRNGCYVGPLTVNVEAEQVCETCQGPLTRDRFCHSCDDFTLAPVERIAPGRIAA